MTRHERTIVAAEQVPSIDATKTARRSREIDPRLDVSQIATRGHVNAARIERITKVAALPAVGAAAFIVAVSFGFLNIGKSSFEGRYFLANQKNWLQSALTYDPATYFDLGGGLKGGPELSWLSRFSPTPESLKVADYAALLSAVRSDSAKFGTDAGSWEAVGGLKTMPTITRPAKAFANNAGELKNGVVAVPEGDPKITVAAYVEGQWAFAVVFRGQCVALVGPVPEGCSDNTTKADEPWNAQTVAFIQNLKPQE